MTCADVWKSVCFFAGCLGFEGGRLADVNGMHVCTCSAVYLMVLHLRWCIFHWAGVSVASLCICYELLVHGCVLLLNVQLFHSASNWEPLETCRSLSVAKQNRRGIRNVESDSVSKHDVWFGSSKGKNAEEKEFQLGINK